MMKRILLASTLIAGLQAAPMAVAPAYAVELNGDTGCDNAGAWMLGTGWTVTGSKCVASSVSAMKTLMQMNTSIKAGHHYRISGALSGYGGSGQFRMMVGVTMPTAPTGSWVTAASTPDIADSFTTSLGLNSGFTPKTTIGPGDSAETGGAMRFSCNSGGWGFIDPVVYPGLGSPHLHEFYGANNIGKSWGFSDFRTKPSSTCSNQLDPSHAINRSGYWIPGMLDGLGHVKRAAAITVYYKGASDPAVMTSGTVTGSVSGTTLTVTAASSNILAHGEYINGTNITSNTSITGQLTGTTGGVGTYSLDKTSTASSTTITVTSPYTGPLSDITNLCANSTVAPHTCIFGPPTGLRMTFGFKSSDGTNGPLDTTQRFSSAFSLSCWGGYNNEGGPTGTGYTSEYTSLALLMASGACAKNSWLHVSMSFPVCWDGTNVDSPNHRDHINYGNSSGICQSDHPVRMPTISIQVFYLIDQAFLDGKWRVSSDEMATGCFNGTTIVAVTAGCTYHGDYFEAWSPTVRTTWENDCIKAHNSCSTEIGDSTGLKTPFLEFDRGPTGGNGGQRPRPDDLAPLTDFGMCPDIAANGTFTCDVTAPNDGVFSIAGFNGASGSFDNISLTELSTGAKGPVTVHN